MDTNGPGLAPLHSAGALDAQGRQVDKGSPGTCLSTRRKATWNL